MSHVGPRGPVGPVGIRARVEEVRMPKGYSRHMTVDLDHVRRKVMERVDRFALVDGRLVLDRRGSVCLVDDVVKLIEEASRD